MMLFYFKQHISKLVVAGNCGITSEGQSSHSKNLMDVGNFGGTTSIQTCANTTIVEVKRLIVSCVTIIIIIKSQFF